MIINLTFDENGNMDNGSFTISGFLCLKGDSQQYWYLEQDDEEEIINLESKLDKVHGKKVRITVEVIE